MTLSTRTALFLSQLGTLTTFVETCDEGISRAFKLVPASCYTIDGKPFPHTVEQELRNGGFEILIFEGLDYFMVPDLDSTNARGHEPQYNHLFADSREKNPSPVKETAPPVVTRYIKGSEDSSKETSAKKPTKRTPAKRATKKSAE